MGMTPRMRRKMMSQTFKKELVFEPDPKKAMTPGSTRWKEQGVDDFEEPVVGMLYVRKSAFRELGRFPKKLRVTIEEID